MPQNITISIAENKDAQELASVMTASFAASGDPAWTLVWGGASPETHDKLAIGGFFDPVERPFFAIHKAVDSSTGKIVGLTRWRLPNPDAEFPSVPSGWKMPAIPGVNADLFNAKAAVSEPAALRDVNEQKDMHLSLNFVHPDYQGQGVAKLLLKSGLEIADRSHTKVWLSSTPKAIGLYEKTGWEVKETYDTDLSKFGGEGVYSPAWMLRLPIERA